MKTEDGKGGRTLLLLAAAVVVLVGLDLAAAIVVPLVLAAFVAAATSPVAEWLQRRGLPNGIAVVAVIVGVLGVLAAFGFIITTALMDLNDAFPRYLAELDAAKQDATAWLASHGMERAARSLAVFDLDAWLSDLLTETVLTGAPDFVSSFVLVLLVVAFILLEATTFGSKARLAQRSGGADLSQLGVIVKDVQKYLVVKTGISLVTGLLVGAWTALWGLEHAVLWGLLGFALNFVPNVGSVLAAIPPVVIALAMHGLGTATAVTAGYVAINMALGNVLEPKLMGRALGLSPLVVILSMIVWGYVLGPVGAVLSAPLTMVLKIVLSHTRDMRWVSVMLAPPRVEDEPARERPPPTEPTFHAPHGASPNEAE